MQARTLSIKLRALVGVDATGQAMLDLRWIATTKRQNRTRTLRKQGRFSSTQVCLSQIRADLVSKRSLPIYNSVTTNNEDYFVAHSYFEPE
jgi:hypothetical protein